MTVYLHTLMHHHTLYSYFMKGPSIRHLVWIKLYLNRIIYLLIEFLSFCHHLNCNTRICVSSLLIVIWICRWIMVIVSESGIDMPSSSLDKDSSIYFELIMPMENFIFIRQNLLTSSCPPVSAFSYLFIFLVYFYLSMPLHIYVSTIFSYLSSFHVYLSVTF